MNRDFRFRPWPFRPWLVPAGVALSLLAAVVVGIATLTPAPSGPAEIPHLDKLMHFLGFFGIVLPVACVLPGRVWPIVALATGFGAAIEVIQPFVGRGAEWGDLAANVAGAVCAALMGRWLHLRVFHPPAPARPHPPR